MKLYELTFEYHDELNPKIWNKEKLRPEVLNKIREIATHFFKFIDVPDLKVEDVVLTGSLANYNYTPYSDIDIHLIVDVKKAGAECKDITAEMFDAKKDLWAQKYNEVRVCDFPVEVFVQDNSVPDPIAMGIYSIKDNKWIQKPKYDRPTIDKKEINNTTHEFKKEIDTVVGNDEGKHKAKSIKDELKKEREHGLHKDGEFSDENIAFKELRNRGIIGKLMNYIKDQDVEKLSLESLGFENQKASLNDLDRVQMARCLEYVRARDYLYQKYEIGGSGSSFESIYKSKSYQIKFASPLLQDMKLSEKEEKKIRAVFQRMVHAKKTYENAYDAVAKEWLDQRKEK